jgi:subtilase family serine protease
MYASSRDLSARVLVLVITVAAVAGFSVVGAVAPPVSHGSAGTPSATPALSPSPSLAPSPLQKVSAPAYSAASVDTAAQYGYTVSPDPAALNPSQTMTVQVSVGSSASLDSFVDQIQNPGSPMYHAFTTLSSLGTAFGVSAPQYAADASYFTDLGLTVAPDPARIYLTVTGTIAQIEQAFHTQIGAFTEQYYSPGQWNPLFGDASAGVNSTTSRLVYLSTGNAYLPSAMDSNGVAGLGTLFAQPDLVAPFPGLSPGTSLTSLGLTTSIPTPTQEIAPGQALGAGDPDGCASHNYTWGVLDGIDWQFLFPCSMQVLSGATNLLNGHSAINGVPDKGQGVTIGIIDVGCPFASDLSEFTNLTGVGILGRLSVIAINTSSEFYDNGQVAGCTNNGEIWGWTGETSLDIEYAATMAPQAHIDLISVGDPALTAFDYAYQVTADYLTTGAATPLPAGVTVLNLVTGTTTSTTSVAASSVTITSNSYGTGEELSAIFGSPTYLALENEGLDELAALGVTNLFASGDYGPATYPFPLQAGIPADASGQTSVGGGVLTAEDNGVEFPDTGVATTIDGLNMTVARTTGIGSFTYWAESEYIVYGYPTGNVTSPALPPGETGGGFGQSSALAQPWWQNSLDIYDSGSLIDPVISGSAGFNMSIYAFGSWLLTYGGTSFACPVFAGIWALIEEQALTAFGTPKMGDINALLFEAHNAQQAGVVPVSAYTPMTDIGTGGVTSLLCSALSCGYNIWEVLDLWGPSSGEAQYMLAGQDEYPQDQNLPYWFGTLDNPAGNGWNYLQGLGLVNAEVLDTELIGQVPATQHALDNAPFYILEVVGTTLVPIQSFIAGQTYALEIVSASGGALTGPFDLTTYSAGTLSTTQIPTASFNYTPGWTPQVVFTNGSEYGYFYATSTGGGTAPDWTFQYFAVEQPPLTNGTLTLGVQTPFGLVTAGEAQVPMETSTGTGPLSTGGQALVLLNGVPVGGALITQTAVQIAPAAIADKTLPVVAPGTTLATYLTSASGLGAFWTDSGQLYADIVAEVAPAPVGPILPVVFTLEATYDGLSSNTVTVVAEPMSGLFSTDVALTNGYVVGTVGFYGMNYLNYLNISVGPSPDEFVNLTYAPGTTYTGTVAVNLTAPSSGPAVLSASAAGAAEILLLSCGGFVGYGDYFALCGLTAAYDFEFQWQDPVVLLPATISTSQGGGAVVGTDTISWSGTAYAGATGALTLVSSAGAEALASGISGSYSLDTGAIPNGAYTAVFSEQDVGAAPTTSSVSFVVDNPPATAPPPGTSQPAPAVPSTASSSSSLAPLLSALVGALAGALAVAIWTGRRRPDSNGPRPRASPAPVRGRRGDDAADPATSRGSDAPVERRT